MERISKFTDLERKDLRELVAQGFSVGELANKLALRNITRGMLARKAS